MKLDDYDLILVNTSGGKDSAVATLVTVRQAEEWGVKDRIVLVHATFPEEWPGTVDLVKRQAEFFGIPRVEIVSRGEGLLDYVRRRGKWPSPKQRWCTSDFKRAPIDKVITRLAPGSKARPARVLNVMGMRADESTKRREMEPFQRNARRTNSHRIVDQWLPIHAAKLYRVWAIVKGWKIPMHDAYALGMPRLSCRFCIYAPKAAVILAARHNPELLRQYVEVEKEVGHTFRSDYSMADVAAAVEAGEAPSVEDWKM